MKNLSLEKARSLIKRELGIGASALVALPVMNGNPQYPWYIMNSGTQLIEVHTNNVKQGKYTDKMVALSITHHNSSRGITEYFYGDTLEYSASYTDWQNREAFCENMEDSQSDPMLHRLKREALDDCWGHFHAKRVSSQIGFETGTILIIKNNNAVFDRYDGFFKSNPKFADYAWHYERNEIPVKNAVLTFVGSGSLPSNGNPVYVLQDSVSKQVYLYDAKCKEGLEVLQRDSLQTATSSQSQINTSLSEAQNRLTEKEDQVQDSNSEFDMEESSEIEMV